MIHLTASALLTAETRDTLKSVLDTLTYIAGGSLDTFTIILGAMSLGLLLGVPLASLAVYGPRWSRVLVSLYVWFFRGVPILVLLFLFYFGLFGLIEEAALSLFNYNLSLSPFAASILVLGLCSTAYQSQIFRGAMQSLPAGQFRAAKALGMSHSGAIINIVLPQALRISIPAWSNEYSILLKDSALAFVLGTQEIMARTDFVANRTYMHLPLYLYASLLYFILTWIGVAALKKLDQKTRIPGLAHDQQG